VQVYAAAADLPAFHQITQLDIRTVPVRGSVPPAGTTADRNDLLGKYTLVALAQDELVRLDHLGPVLRSGALDGMRVASLPLAPANSASGVVALGDRVDVILSSTATTGSPRSGVLREVLVLDLRSAGAASEPVILIAAVPPSDESTLTAAGGTARFFLVRVSPYASP